MAKLTFYGGGGDIGGNKILLESDGARIWLDFGMSFKQSGRYFDKILVITHIDEMKESFPMRIEVTKGDDRSRVEVV